MTDPTLKARLLAEADKTLNGYSIHAPHLVDLLRAAADALPGDGDAVCVWQQDDEDGESFSTGCGNYYLVNDADTDGMNFCLYCGSKAEFAKAGDDEAAAPQPETST